MDLRKVKKLIELLEESDLSEIEITEGDDKVRITKSVKEKQQSNVVHTSNEAEVTNITNTTEDIKPRNKNGFHEVKAPMIGTFYQSSEIECSIASVLDAHSRGATNMTAPNTKKQDPATHVAANPGRPNWDNTPPTIYSTAPAM